ncbi:ribokinase [Actinokineospora globicatena]|uniref:ribokinase n=1 Tax=Actinokineospora globicatena TaxID=103729 RepID=UPI0020A5FE83|nr:ribokinase [Actinokineospora globicatena]MCP2301281.1 ribokinase [Actinokineospora globicatena]GLW77080.1 ribokinase [Actinokineospora globicatena]GLW83914.1 ribokinase [Actinokineospora globicatena]
MSGTLVVVGSANADLVVEVARRPAAGETVLGGDTRVAPGGKGANTAVAAARSGGLVRFIGAVGQDAHGDVVLASLTEAGVDVSGVRRVARPTGVAYIAVTPDGENSIIVSPGANGDLLPADVRLDGARVVVASLEVPVPVVEHAVLAAGQAGIRAVVNLSPVAVLSPQVFALLDPLVVNEHEAAGLGNLLALGVRSAVVTRGALGADVITAEGTTTVPAPKVDVVDTTGAGDAFTGALAVGLANGESLVDAVRVAVKVASLSVTLPGAQPSYPTQARTNRSASSRP